MPQKCRILGVNSVTNIEPEAGVMPAPIIRNADWFENLNPLRVPGLALLPDGQGLRVLLCESCRLVHRSSLYSE